MSSNDSNSSCSNNYGFCGFDEPISINFKVNKKPLEIYTFVDPLCPECWALEPVLKKLTMNYHKYFTLRYLIGGRLYSCKENKGLAQTWDTVASRTGMSCDGDLWLESPISSPFAASIAIKAAELQGKQIGIRYLRKLRELLFLNKRNIDKKEILLECARSIDGLDQDEFEKDLHSESAIKALQYDIKTTKEMGVALFPTLVFFNDNIDDEGLLVTGVYDYDVYEKVLEEMLNEKPTAAPPIFLEDFLKHYSFVATKEISVVYDLTAEEVEKEMKKLVLRQVVERIPVKHGTFWRYIGG